LAEAQRTPAAVEWQANWALVAAATAGVSLSAVSVSSLGVMMEPIEQEFGWSRAQISLGTSLVSFIGMGLATFAGLAIDRVGARRIGIVAAVLMCAGIGLMSAVGGELWQWWALWALVGISASAMPTVWVASVSSHFTAARGLAVAVTLSGSGIATSLVPVVAERLVEGYGWRTAYVGIAGIWAVVVLPLVLLFFRDAHARPAGASTKAAPATADELPGLTARQGFASAAFYKLALAAFLSMSAGVAIILNLFPVLRSTGLTPATAAWVAGIIGFATITGRIIGGWLMDRISAGLIAALAAVGAAVLPLLLLLMPGSVTAAAVGVAVYGLMGGAKVPAVAYLASRHFGARAFGVLYGAVNTVIALGVGLGPLVANLVYDMTGSYTPVMWAAVPFVLAAALLYLSLGPYPEFAKDDARDGVPP
jgi:MFS family permease